MATRGLNVLFKVRRILVGMIATGGGILLGCLLDSSDSAELLISIPLILATMLVIIHRPLDGILVLLAVMPFVEESVYIPMGAGIPDLTFSRFTLAFLAIFALAQAAIGKLHFARPGLTEVWIGATVIGVMTSAGLVGNPKGVIQTTITLHFTPLVMYFFAKSLVWNKDDLHALFLAIVILGSAVALYAVYEHETGNMLFLAEDESASELWTDYTEHLRQIRGLLGMSSNFARVLISSIPVAFYLFLESETLNRKIALVGALAVQGYGLFLTYNRTSWYALLISLSFLQFFYPQFRKVFFVIVLVAVAALWATWDDVSESAVVNERINSKASTMEGREARWNAGYDMWRAKPIRGWGSGRYKTESGRFRTDGGRKNFSAIENDYLNILVASGLIGFVPYLLFLLTPLVNSLRLFFRARAPGWSGFARPEVIAVYWGIILSFVIGSYTQIQTEAIVKMIPFAVTGAVVGTHEHWLRGSESDKRSAPSLLPACEG
jgi:hypothetical protein